MHHIVSRGHTRPLTEINFVQDGPNRTLLVSSAHDKLPQIRNGDTGDWIGTFQGHKGAVWSTKVDTLTRTLAISGSGDFTAKLWCVSTGKELYEFKHIHVVKSVDFSHDTLHIATGCQDGLIRIYSTVSPSLSPTEIRVSETGMSAAITKVLWTDIENMLLVAKRSGEVQQWDLRCPDSPVLSTQLNGLSLSSSPSLSPSPSPSLSSVMDMELSRNHNLLLTTCGRKVTALNVSSLSILWEREMPLPLSFAEEGGSSLHPDGSRFITGGSDLWLREFNVESGELLRTFKGHHGPVRCVRYHPNGSVVASGSEDGTIRLW
eukprot:CAMPEP_0182418852 /NCGR_PEP_ID=MMETSP1167-20130531/3204_1 /TAXON_ID=2988 /ORGANISM="Mallomonas Sp, Strain CCMP3275" /LENGTH=318 /DNA_ID=CAMNT_0024593293 /DNA_START=212 /DNA_END=1165 /DNA_ORIENTATION=-